MNTVKAQKTDDNNKPPSYRVVSDSEVIIQPRGARSNKPDDLYHLSPASPPKPLDNTEPLEDVFFESPNFVQNTSETRSSHASSSSSDGEFLRRINLVDTPYSVIQSSFRSYPTSPNTAQVVIDGVTTTTTATTQADITFIESTRTVTPSAPGLSVQLPDTSRDDSDTVSVSQTLNTTTTVTTSTISTSAITTGSVIVPDTHDSVTDESDSDMTETTNYNPTNFAGTAVEDAENWLRHFENYCQFKGFDNAKTMAMFKVLLTDSAATWLDSLSGETLASWNNLKTAFTTRYTTPAFMKFKSAKSLFNTKQGQMTTDDYHALMQRLGKQLGANEDMLRYAILNGLREDIAKYVIQKQPADMNALLEAARVGEMCYPVNNSESNAEVTTQLTALQEQLRQLSLKMDTPMVSSVTDGGNDRTSSSPPPRRVRFADDRRSRRDDRFGRNRSNSTDRWDTRERSRDRSLSRDRSYDRQRSRDREYDGRDDRVRRYDRFNARGTSYSPNRRYGDSYSQREWRGSSRGSFRGQFRGRGMGRGRGPRFYGAPWIDASRTCTRCGYRQHENFNDCPAVNQECNSCGKTGHFLRVCRSRGNVQRNTE